jgi:hypothetical protein
MEKRMGKAYGMHVISLHHGLVRIWSKDEGKKEQSVIFVRPFGFFEKKRMK